ncbi:sulfite reductase flavoprotein subunit alpha [Variovorax soli]|uniref:Sulfite reductase (NADPH) flavoprotein alpha-component n=1 Tax=Variovorax soli TaxID=376815 RepID=A0ABU1NHH4_9BURK|nr:sulfite reductase flavoprotein subunit alpha [Variovorax soli]MDR6537910.1 sulfite reductase (NADPH) flavoprotein alpha-component [Variovorax soli]
MAFLRRAWFQIHWFIGITAGSVLLVIGLSGAVLSFRAEITDLIDPGLHRVSPQAADAQPLTPAELLDRLQAAHPGQRVAALTLFAQAGRPARVNFAPPPGERRGETRLADPYTAALLPEPRAEAFFELVESLHRWLLMPRDTGKPVTGTLAAGLLVLALSGLYLRWPRRPLAWRNWLRLDFALRGRAFLWSLHAVVGTVALLAYLVSGLTGIYWGFDAVRARVDDAAGEGRAARTQRMPGAAGAPVRLDLERVWGSFQQATTGDWSQVTLRLPARNGSQVEANYLRAEPEHERARNRLSLHAATGEATQHERYADKPLAGRLVNSIYPLHMGTYWGLPGRIVMTLSSLALALFAITGWMLYLGRRRTQQAVRAERVRWSLPGTATAESSEQVLIAFATQTGHAERVALQTAAALRAAGVGTVVKTLAELSADALLHFRKVLWVVSTFGDGDPPDSARAFARRFAQQAGPQLRHVHYGVLALGDWHYATFCGFGRKLDHDLRSQGAQALFPMVEVDNGNPEAIGRWQRAIADAFDLRIEAWHALQPAAASSERAFEGWRLERRTLLNEGSQGDPLFEIELHSASARNWEAGALLEVLPHHPDGSAQPPLAPRSYSVASIAADGCIQLLVRQARHDNGLGLASGWLTAHAPLGAHIDVRLVANPGFAAAEKDVPCIFIGNGSGFAGLRSHLRERMQRGHGRNWLVYGERQAAHDAICADEIATWQALGKLQRTDLVYSRDQAQRVYVQDRLREAAGELRRWIADGAVVYVCGSLEGMAPGVDAALCEVLGAEGLDDLIAQGRYRRDVY